MLRARINDALKEAMKAKVAEEVATLRLIMAALKDTGRGTAILVGLETDVCIAHSAIGLLQQGYRVVVVADATASPGTGHEVGLERVRGAGTLLSSVKSLYFEWIRTANRSDEFMEKYAAEIGLPEGITL